MRLVQEMVEALERISVVFEPTVTNILPACGGARR
jgi:hypothetical protein